MNDNIDSKCIENRRFIIELRFDHKANVADKKGSIIEGIKALNLFSVCHWEMNHANAVIFDNVEKNNARNIVRLGLDTFSFVSTKIDSVSAYYDYFEKIYKIVVEQIGSLNIRRIGCRIQGTYKTKSSDFHTIFSKMKEDFPTKFYLEKYNAEDILFQVNYPNGMYNVGPVKEEHDPFVDTNFAYEGHTTHVGVAIDTDNFLSNEKVCINDNKLIKEVYILSLSVEKDLYDNLKDY